MILSGWIDHRAATAPDKTAFTFEGRDISYGGLADEVARAAGALAGEFGVGHGDRVAYLGRNSPDMAVLLFACARLGAIFLPLNWRLAGPEHVFMLNHAEPAVLFVGPGYEEHVADIASELGATRLAAGACFSKAEPRADGPGAAGDDVLLCYTSGTTGRPKGALLSQNALYYNALNSNHVHDLTSGDVVLTTLPMFHVGGLNIQTLPALHAGATVILHAAFDLDAAFEALDGQGVTLTLLVPTQLSAMMADPRWATSDFSSLRMILVGSTIVAASMVEAGCARGVPFVQLYGSTETAPIAAYTAPAEAAAHPASTGKPALHCELRVVDEAGNDVGASGLGEVLVRGPNVMSGYWRDAQATEAALSDGWFHSGDIGHFDEDGYLYIEGRSKDVIISGGENVYPAAVEAVLAESPDIAEVAVVGRPDDYWGEVVAAVVVPAANATVDLETISALCQGRIARFQHPREVVLADALPRNAMGKVVKEDLRAMVGGA